MPSQELFLKQESPEGPIYARFGHALPDKNGDESRVLPIRATYVVDIDGTAVLAFVGVDYRKRREPVEILSALQAIDSDTLKTNRDLLGRILPGPNDQAFVVERRLTRLPRVGG